MDVEAPCDLAAGAAAAEADPSEVPKASVPTGEVDAPGAAEAAEEEEEIEDLPAAEKEVDPYYKAKIKRVIDGKEYFGEVEDIECGKVTKERLYRIKYQDGDMEHLDEAQVKEMQVKGAPEAGEGAAEGAAGEEAAADEAMEDAAAGDEEDGVAKKPARGGRGRGRGRGRGAGRGAAKAKAKGKAKAKAKAKAKPKAAVKAKAKAKGKAKAVSKKPARK